MTNSTNRIFLASLTALPALLAGCADENPWKTSPAETGTISLSLTADPGYRSSRPVFRSTETEYTLPAELTPGPGQFSIKLEKAEGTSGAYSKTWASYDDFVRDLETEKFAAGSYTITATYGDKTSHGFEAPSFEASKSFTVLADRETQIQLEAELTNALATVGYTDDFKDYMEDWHAYFSTPGTIEDLKYEKTETRPAFIAAGDETGASRLNVHFKTKKGKETDLYINTFTPVVKTHHNVTLGIRQDGDYDNATLTITFDDAAAGEETVEIDMTAALAPGPAFSFTGFENNQHLDLSEHAPAELRVDVAVPAGMRSAELSIASEPANGLTWLADGKADLLTANPAELQASGVRCTGFAEGSTMAFADLSGLKNLPAGKHTVSLTVTDMNGNTGLPATVILDTTPISATSIPSATPTAFGSDEIVVTLDYNGANPDELTFFAQNPDNSWQRLTTVSTESAPTETRAYATSRYTFHLSGYTHKMAEVKVAAFRNYAPGDENTPGKAIAQTSVKFSVPAYTIETDAFAGFAYVRVKAKNEADLDAIQRNIIFKLGGETKTLPADGILTLTGLTPGTAYTLSSSLTEDKANSHSFTTETDLPIPNGNFETAGKQLESGELQEGGNYKVSPTTYTMKSSFSYTLPADWATVNDLTAWSGSSNKNTWFVVPSSFQIGGKGRMRNVGYNHNGITPATTGGAFNSSYYCENSPSADQLKYAAGEIFLGTYSFNGTETRTEGIGFSSRPSSISFEYNYTLKDNKQDQGYACIKLLDGDNGVLGEKTYNLGSGSGTITFTPEYTPFGKEAAKLIISFKSSNQATPPVTIPTGDALNEHAGLGNKTISANQYKAVATGSVLDIDNVTAHYTTAPSKASKRNSSRKQAY